MKFIYKDSVYAINFQRKQHLVKAYSGGIGGKEQLSKYPSTEVTLIKLDPMELGTHNAEVVAFGSTSCYHKDKFDPEVGRRKALEDLCRSPRNRLPRNGSRARIPREMATLIWKAYFNRSNPDIEVSDNNNSGGTPTSPNPVAELPIKEAELLNEAYVVG